MTCPSGWKLLVIIACEATIAASVARTRLTYKVPVGTLLKNGFVYAVSEGSVC
jgi:hypothetical protein